MVVWSSNVPIEGSLVRCARSRSTGTVHSRGRRSTTSWRCATAATTEQRSGRWRPGGRGRATGHRAEEGPRAAEDPSSPVELQPTCSVLGVKAAQLAHIHAAARGGAMINPLALLLHSAGTHFGAERQPAISCLAGGGATAEARPRS